MTARMTNPEFSLRKEKLDLHREPVSHPPETVLTYGQLLEWLQISPRTAQRYHLADRYPSIQIGPKCRRYVVGHVLKFLAEEQGL